MFEVKQPWTQLALEWETPWGNLLVLFCWVHTVSWTQIAAITWLWHDLKGLNITWCEGQEMTTRLQTLHPTIFQCLQFTELIKMYKYHHFMFGYIPLEILMNRNRLWTIPSLGFMSICIRVKCAYVDMMVMVKHKDNIWDKYIYISTVYL